MRIFVLLEVVSGDNMVCRLYKQIIESGDLSLTPEEISKHCNGVCLQCSHYYEEKVAS